LPRFLADPLSLSLVLKILYRVLSFQGVVVLRGIKNVKIYAREIVASRGSKIDVSAPDWNQQYTSAVIPGGNGEDGKHGVNGPRGGSRLVTS